MHRAKSQRWVCGRMLAVVVFCGVALLAICGCRRALTSADLVGTYSCTHRVGKEVLTLKPDGTCLQVIALSSGTITHSGSWSYDPADRNLTLSQVILVDDSLPGVPSAPPYPVAVWDLPVQRTMTGKIELGVNPEMGIVFR